MFRKTLFLILLSIFVFTCKSGKENEKTEGEKKSPAVAGNDGDPSKHFDLTPETVVIRHVAKVVRKISPDHSTFTLDGSADNVQNLAPGKVMLIAGVDAGKVTTIRKDGKDVIVTVGPVRITDVIRNGTISWSAKDVDESRGMWMTTEAGTTLSSVIGPQTPLPRFIPTVFFESVAEAASAPSNKVKLTVGDWKIELTFSQGDISFYAAKQKFPVWGGITAKINMGKASQTSGHVVVQNGTITDGEMDTPMDGDIDVDVTSQTQDTPAFPGKALIEIPLEWVIPVETPFFIPIYVGFKVNFLFQPEIPTKKTLIELKLHSDFHGNMGFGYTQKALIKKSNLTFEPTSPQVTGPPSMGDVAARYAFQLPRIAVGLGARSVISTGIFMDLVSAITVNVASATSMFPCRAITLTETASAGFEYEIGPDVFKAFLQKVLPNTKLKGEVHKVEVQKWTPQEAWYDPHINACKP